MFSEEVTDVLRMGAWSGTKRLNKLHGFFSVHNNMKCYVNHCSLFGEQISTSQEAEFFKGLKNYPHGNLKSYTI